MTTIKDIQSSVSGFRYVMEQLDLRSGLGRRCLLSQEFLTDIDSIDKELNAVAEMLVNINNNEVVIDKIQTKLEQARDIRGTLSYLKAASVLDDIELFEIKHFSLLVDEISLLLQSLQTAVMFPDLNSVIDILDPEKQRVPHFYIHPLYSNELASLRQKYKTLITENPEKAEEIRLKSVEVEDEIRKDISRQLFEFANDLLKALDLLAYLDLLIAKAKLVNQIGLSRPTISNDKTMFEGLFNPQIKSILHNNNKEYQVVDVDLHSKPCLITGANMAGKTVLLKSVALAQYMFQFGFYVPAKNAKIIPVDVVMTSLNDDQSDLTGLSSYAAEMLNIDSIIKSIKSGKKVLALIDELARTTNPNEGEAIVGAVAEIFEKYNVMSLITTHYNVLQINCHKLKVKGLMHDKLGKKITINNINEYMDYSLVENNSNEPSQEALNIAAILNLDGELLDAAKRIMVKEER